MNLAHNLVDAADRHRDRVALRHRDSTVTYAELAAGAASYAKRFERDGIRPGDRIALRLPNRPAYVAAYYGALAVGAIVVPLNVLLREGEVETRLAHATPELVVAPDDPEPPATDAPLAPLPRDAGDAAVILYTSGTSGDPKGAVLTHGSLQVAAEAAAGALALSPDDVLLGSAPLSHVLAMSSGMNASIVTGAQLLLVERFDAADTLDEMARAGVTILLGVPTMCIALCAAAPAAAALPPIRIAHVGGAPVPAEVAREFEATFGGEVAEGYGLTEMSGIATTYGRDQRRKPGSVGTPRGSTELRVVSLDGRPLPAGETGEVQLRGPSVIRGYWRDDAATAAAIDADGWLATGDMGYVDADGCLFLVDRKKDVILRGGYSVYPREVEEVLYAHPDVAEVAVVGVPHPTLGEEIAALVVPRAAAAATDPAAIREYARERLAAYKYPREIVLVESLPKGPTGKVLKRAIDVQGLLRT
jgi:long-chain acyl-CoA synthetase